MAPSMSKLAAVAAGGLIVAAVAYHLCCKKDSGNSNDKVSSKSAPEPAAAAATPEAQNTAEADPTAAAPETTATPEGKSEAALDAEAVAPAAAPPAAAAAKPAAKAKKEKKAKAPKKKKLSKVEAAAVKEGGKKGQDLSGMADMGGVTFFHLAMNECGGDFALLQLAMDAANKDVDPAGDDRKGGAGHIGKMLFSAGDEKLAVYCHVPKEQEEKVDIDEWVGVINAVIQGTIVNKSEDGRFVKFEALADPEKEKFPLKMRDSAIAAGFKFLRDKKLVMDDSSSDDSDVNLAEIAGIEW